MLCPACRDGQWSGWLTGKDADQLHDKMLARNRFLLLVVVGGAALAIISLSLQFCKYTVSVCAQLISHVCKNRSSFYTLNNQNHIAVSVIFWLIVKPYIQQKNPQLSCCVFVFKHAHPLFCFPTQETPFIPKQSRIPYRLPINIQHQQWASGYSETSTECVATHSHLLWNA